MKTPPSIRMRFSVLFLSFFLLCRVASATTTFIQVGQGGGTTFTPSFVVISQGDTVQWDWVTGRHSVTSGTPGNPDGIFDSGTFTTPHSFSFTFPIPGNYQYYCQVHGIMMTGTIAVAVVDPPSPTVGPTATPTPTVTPTTTPTPTPNPTPTPTPTSTPVHTPTPTPASPTPTSTPVHTPTPTPASPTPTATATATPVTTATPTAAPTTTPAPSATPTATATPTAGPAQALNISTRLRVQTGNNVLIGGFIVTGTAPKKVVVRGLGPSLTSGSIPDALADPTLELHESNGTLLFSNDNWQDDPAQAAQLSALGIAPVDPAESGIVISLPPAAYTAILAGKNGGTGIGLVEVYDADQAADSHLANISTRGFVLTGNNVMIGGFILGGSGNTHVVLRGIGPSLAQQGLSPVLDDPTLELHDGNGTLLVMNDNWQDDPVSASQLTAIGLGPQDPLESGISVSLPPGAFTAILAGKNGGTGIGLVEVYNIGP